MAWMLGAGMGFLGGGPFWALAGGAIHHYLTKRARKNTEKGFPGITDHSIFLTCLIVVLVRVGLVKGSLTEAEVRTIHKFFKKNLNYKNEDLKLVNELISKTREMNPDLSATVARFRKVTQGHYSLLLLALSYQVALVGNGLTSDTQEFINRLAGELEISYEKHNGIRGKYSLDALLTPYHVLGLKSSASREEIKKAYRTLIHQYHPDRVVHMGEESAEEAHLKFLEIQSAYQELEKERGL